MTPSSNKILIINNAEPEIQRFVEPLIDLVQSHRIDYRQIEYRQLDRNSIDFVDPLLFQGVLMSASPRGDDIVSSHVPLYNWLKKWKKPAFGICAGHQIPGVLFGAELFRDIHLEIGQYTIRIVNDDPIFARVSKCFHAEQQHHDSISCPSDFVILCCSDTCPVQMVRHRKYPIYTTQFHAEITNKTLITNFLDIYFPSKNLTLTSGEPYGSKKT
ncbi:gamma-glutamyl-gamma-aminobutyrate hydrolase family protein [bacterium]|nr:gamma-glutamyl-gamma-aminobutyrate hydrolase family protein [bacterium]